MAPGEPAREIELLDFHPSDENLADELVAGLELPQKRLPPKYFYDERGSKLFDDITELPEYYPTRTELAIMRERIGEMAEQVGPQASLIELGSGSSLKTRILLQHLDRLAAYVPVDISRDHLLNAALEIQADFPRIDILPVCADFTRPFELPDPRVTPIRNLVYFPGSTIGNFDPPVAGRLLGVMFDIAAENGALLIGVDLKKDPAILERAYNDSQGITAAFNLNMLARMNRELGANFDLSAFTHRAIWNAEAGRIEMHLVSRRRQRVVVAGHAIDFDEGEYILTECSYKYAPEEFVAMAEAVGFEKRRIWMDERELFSVHYYEVP